jgi:hypothetical protein
MIVGRRIGSLDPSDLVQQFNAYNFYTLGLTIHPLTEMKTTDKYTDVFLLVYNAKRDGWFPCIWDICCP